MIKECNNQENINNILKIFMMIIIFILGIASQLYVEHSTIVNVILSISLLMHCRRKNLKLASSLSMTWTIATGIGTLLMFVIPKLFYQKENRVAGYRKLNMKQISSIINSCKVNSGIIARNIEKNVLIFFVLISVGCLLIYFHKKNLKKKIYRIAFFLQIMPVIYIIISNLYINNLELSGHLGGLKIILDDVALAAMIVGFVLILYNLNLKKLLFLNIYLISIMVLSMIPLLVVYPLPARVMFQSYIFLVALTLVNFEYIIFNTNECVKKGINIILKIIFPVLMFMLVFIFNDIKKIDDNRTKYIQEQMKSHAKKIEIYRIPYKYVFWDGEWMFYRYYYYQKYGDIKIREDKKVNRKFL